MGFFSIFAKNKLGDAKEAATMAIFNFDPEAATDAELEVAQEQLGEDVLLRNDFKKSLDKEVKEYEDAVKARDTALDLLQSLKSDYDSEENEEKRATLLQQATAVSNELTELEESVISEESDIDLARQHYDEMVVIVDQNQDKLQEAYKMRDRLVSDKKAADRQLQRAEEQKERQARLQKSRSGDGLTALSRLSAATEASKAKASHMQEMTQRVNEAKGGKASAIEEIMKSRASETPKEATDPFARLA